MDNDLPIDYPCLEGRRRITKFERTRVSPPSLISIWLADAVTQSEETSKVTVSGIFDGIEIQPDTEFAAGAVVFFAVTNVHVPTRLKLLYVDLADDEIVLERDVLVDATPLEATDITVRVNRIPVPHAGPFAWEVFCGEERIGSTRLEVRYKP